MSGLLSADAAAILLHILVYIFVTYCSLCVADSELIKGLVESEVGHNGCDNSIVIKISSLFHILSINVEDMVSCDYISQLVYAETSVCISIVCEAYIKSIVHYIFL